MDAKSKANFINSVAGGAEVVCATCGAKNKAGSKFCIACGNKFAAAEEESKTPAFSSVGETEEKNGTTVEKESVKTVQCEEPVSVFAQGLPSWSLEPPQVMVRRH